MKYIIYAFLGVINCTLQAQTTPQFKSGQRIEIFYEKDSQCMQGLSKKCVMRDI